MSYIERVINLTITLQPRQGSQPLNTPANQNPQFQGTNANTVKIMGGGKASQNGVRISAKVARPGAVSLSTAQIGITNLPLSLINQLGTLGTPYIYLVGPNTITVEAGDTSGPLSTIFSGTITNAFGDFTGAPDGVFNISAKSLGVQAVSPAPTASFNGTVSVADVMAGFAKQAGLGFVNNGVTAQLASPYFHGSIVDQIKAIATHAGVSWTVDDTKNTLYIWPKNGSRTPTGTQLPIIAPPPKGGMVGYPTYTATGLKLKTLYESDIGYGTQVQVQSSLTQANGTWTVTYLDYDLECQAQNGPWFTNLEVVAPQQFLTVPQPNT